MKPCHRYTQTVCFVLCSLVLLIGSPSNSHAESLYSLSKKGQEAYDAGDYQKAQDYFIKAQLEAPDNPHVYYNLGNAQYKNGDYDSALNHYKQALKADDPSLKQKSHFNMGNTYFKQNDYEKSIGEYEEALKIDPKDEDAKKNIAYVKKVMEQAKKQKNQNKDDQKNDKKNKDQDKDQDKSGQDQKNQGQKDQNKDQKNQDQKNKGQDKKDGSSRQDEQDKGKQPQPPGDEKDKEQKPEASQARQGKEELPGDEEQKQAEKMLNRLKDQPGQALIPAYQQREVDKDW